MVFICTATITHYDNLLYHKSYCSIVCRQNGELHGFLRKWQTFDDSCDSEDCVIKYVPDWMRYDFYKYYWAEKRYDSNYGRVMKNQLILHRYR